MAQLAVTELYRRDLPVVGRAPLVLHQFGTQLAASDSSQASDYFSVPQVLQRANTTWLTAFMFWAAPHSDLLDCVRSIVLLNKVNWSKITLVYYNIDFFYTLYKIRILF